MQDKEKNLKICVTVLVDMKLCMDCSSYQREKIKKIKMDQVNFVGV